MAEEVKKEEVKKKGPLGKIKELAEDKEAVSYTHLTLPTTTPV